jgi:serine/threonine-protein kinase RsbW
LETILVLDQKYPSTLESVDQAEAIIVEAANATGFDEDDQHRISMAFRECMVNAVVHGNRYNKNKQVTVHAERTGDELMMRVRDEGEGFEMNEVPDPLDTNNLLRHSGRGLFLMGAFMDEMKVHKVEPNGTEVTMRKRVSSEKTEENG